MGLAISDDVSKITLGGLVLYDRDSIWQTMTGSSDFFTSYTMLYRIHGDEKYIEAVIGGKMPQDVNGGAIFIDLSSLVKNITTCDLYIATGPFNVATVSVSKGAVITTNASNSTGWGGGSSASTIGAKTPFARIFYDELV